MFLGIDKLAAVKEHYSRIEKAGMFDSLSRESTCLERQCRAIRILCAINRGLSPSCCSLYFEHVNHRCQALGKKEEKKLYTVSMVAVDFNKNSVIFEREQSFLIKLPPGCRGIRYQSRDVQ